jgi:LytR cell envelope-related transcriptional attenuator
VSERARPTRSRILRRAAIVGIAVLLLVGTIVIRAATTERAPARRAKAPDASTTNAERVKVEVLNATDVRGLARRATMLLRDKGFDVLYMGSTSERLDSTIVLDRSGNRARAQRVAEALGGARVESRPDTSRYLDVTVMLGRAWRAPAEPFYP